MSKAKVTDKMRLDWLAKQSPSMFKMLKGMTAWERTHGGWNKSDEKNFRECLDCVKRDLAPKRAAIDAAIQAERTQGRKS